ncbi:hypothetical protein D3C86_1124240 [compost metagenome]
MFKVFLFNAQLRKHQQVAIYAVEKKDLGIIVAPPASGKTILGINAKTCGLIKFRHKY